MKHSSCVVAAVAATGALFFSCSVDAASDELAEVRRQLQELTQRVDRLERRNAALEAQNETLAAQRTATAAPPATQAKTAPDAASGADWPSRISIEGDLRYRHQQTEDSRASAGRNEDLLRARLSIEAKVTDDIIAAVGVSTTQDGNPRGANVRLDDEFSRKSLFLDLGYIDWRFAEGAHAIGGKMKAPFARPGQSLFWDNDVNPEGVALTYATGPWFASGYGFWIDENVEYAGAASGANDTTDTKMYGAQFGRRFELGAADMTIAAMYYDLAAAQGRRPFFGESANGNSLTPSGGLAYDFQVVEIMAEYNARLARLPLQVWLDFAQNQDAELDTAMAAGVMLGKASGSRSWQAGLAYQFVEKDALFAQHVDSDFAGGVTDNEGWVLRAGYAPLQNWVLNATYFMAQGAVDVGDEFDHDRLHLEFNVKF